MTKDAYWFPHDANARNDTKLIRLRRIAGHAGVGAYWYVIEMLRESDGYRIEKSALEDISFDARFPEEIFNQLMECKLLQHDESNVWSDSLIRRMAKLDEIKEKRRAAGSKGGKARQANAKQTSSKRQANAKQNPSKSKLVEKSVVEKSGSDQSVVEKNIKEKDTLKRESEFDAFWTVYPRKVGKKAAQKAFSAACKDSDWPGVEAVLSAVCAAQDGEWRNTEPKYIPHPATWLNRGSWSDEAPKSGLQQMFDEIDAEAGNVIDAEFAVRGTR